MSGSVGDNRFKRVSLRLATFTAFFTAFGVLDDVGEGFSDKDIDWFEDDAAELRISDVDCISIDVHAFEVGSDHLALRLAKFRPISS